MLPGVGVHQDHDAGEDEQQDDEDQTDNQTRLSLELVSEESVENEEGDVGHHRSGSQVTCPGLLEIIGFLLAAGKNGILVVDILSSQRGDIECAELGIPVGINLNINRISGMETYFILWDLMFNFNPLKLKKITLN